MGYSQTKRKMEKLIRHFKNMMNEKMASMLRLLRLENEWQKNLLIESVLQHYSRGTTCLDLVDNVWTALWFGYHEYVEGKYKAGIYVTYKPRSEFARSGCLVDEYQYILLFTVAARINIRQKGVMKPLYNYVIDLREALPSIFVRPHAQHAWILKSNKVLMDKDNNFANNVIAALRIRTKDACEWLGNGKSLEINSLFFSPIFDYGYDTLLEKDGNIARYYKM